MAGKSNRKSWLDDLLGEEDDEPLPQPQVTAVNKDESTSLDSSKVSSTSRRTSGKSVRFKESTADETADKSTSGNTWSPSVNNASATTVASPTASFAVSSFPSISQVQRQVTSDNDDITLIRQTYEKQLALATSMLEEQIQLMQGEKSRRLNELRCLMEESASEKQEIRNQYRTRIDEITSEHESEMERLKKMHRSTLDRLQADHLEEVNRLRKERLMEVESMTLLSDRVASMQSLVDRWKDTTDIMESVTAQVTRCQKELANQELKQLSEKEITVSNLSSLYTLSEKQLERDKEHYLESEKRLLQLIASYEERVRDGEEKLQEEKHQFAEEKKRQEKIYRDRERYLQEKSSEVTDAEKACEDEKYRLKEMKASLAARAKEVEKSNHDASEKIASEMQRLSEMEKTLEEKRRENLLQSSDLKHRLEQLESLDVRLKDKETALQAEREQLVHLAKQVKDRSQELEQLAESVAKQRAQGLAALAEAENISRHLDSRSQHLKQQIQSLNSKQIQLAEESDRLRKEAETLRETKDNILCSLCSMSVSQARSPGQTSWFSLYDPLYLWQVASSKDTALLAEETAFVSRLPHERRASSMYSSSTATAKQPHTDS